MNAFIRPAEQPPADPFAAGLLSTRQVSLLLGIPERDFKAEWERQRALNPAGTHMTIPKQWIRQGKEIAARLGVDSLEEALRVLEKEQSL